MCEFFYQNITFRLEDYQLPVFLVSKVHLFTTRRLSSSGKKVSTKRPSEINLWIRSLIIQVHIRPNSGGFVFPPNNSLRRLLDCPRLVRVTLSIVTTGLLPFCLFKETGDVLGELKERSGNGLKVYCDMGWDYDTPGTSSGWRQDPECHVLRPTHAASGRSFVIHRLHLQRN